MAVAISEFVRHDLEDPLALLIHRRDQRAGGRDGHKRRLRFEGDVDERQRRRRQRRANHRIHLLIRDELAHVLRRFRTVGLVVERNKAHLLAGNFGGKRADRFHFRLPECGAGSAGAHGDADLDFRLRGLKSGK